MEIIPKPLQGWGKMLGAHREGKALSPSQPSIPEGRFPIRTCERVGGRLRAHKWWRPGGSEVMWGVAASRGSGNGCPWGWVGGGWRPSAREGEPGECKWAWEAAGLEPWALQDPGSEIQSRGSGHVWHPARVFICAGDRLVRDVHLGVSHAQPRGAAQWGCSCTCGTGGGEAASLAFSRTQVTSCSCSPTKNSLHSHRWAQFFIFGSSSLPCVKVFWRNQIFYDFTLNHDISQALENKPFLYVFMTGICDNTALVKGETFSKYFPPLKCVCVCVCGFFLVSSLK